MLVTLLKKVHSFWLEDGSFALLLLMLLTIVFVLPIVMDSSENGVLYFNILLLSAFYTGTFSTRSKWLIAISGILFATHLLLRVIRYGDNPFSYYILENIVAIANSFVFILINVRLLFRNNSVNLYRIIGTINVYLLSALWVP